MQAYTLTMKISIVSKILLNPVNNRVNKQTDKRKTVGTTIYSVCHYSIWWLPFSLTAKYTIPVKSMTPNLLSTDS
jgi:hypothetical protein